MDPLDFLLGVVGSIMQIAAVIITISLSIRFFSTTSETSPKVVRYSLLYLFGSAIILYVGTRRLMEIAGRGWLEGERLIWFAGTSSLAGTAVLNLLCGFLIVILYLSTRRDLLPSLKRRLDHIRSYIRAKLKS